MTDIVAWLASPQATLFSGVMVCIGFWVNAHKTWWGLLFMLVATFRAFVVLVR